MARRPRNSLAGLPHAGASIGQRMEGMNKSGEHVFMVQVAHSLQRILNKRVVRNESSNMSSDEILNTMSNPQLSFSADERGGVLYFDIDMPGDQMVAVHLNRRGSIRSTILEKGVVG